jgi:phosphoserine phosphatase RsbU/P
LSDPALEHETAEDLYENAPCGYVTTTPDGTILRANKSFSSLLKRSRESLSVGIRLQDLLAPGSRIYHETHLAPLLLMQGEVREIALEFVRQDGGRVPVLINSVVRRDAEDNPSVVLMTVFDARERRSYENELLRARTLEREMAHSLQRDLLVGELPRAANLEVAAAYKPSVADLEIGGDWFDSFWLDDGATIAMVVGDVVGRGIGAAATMAQLRSAVRALAAGPHRPAALLEGLDRYARRHQVGYATTLIYAHLTLLSGVLCFACAGHPPPLIRPADEEARFLWDGRSTPLAVEWHGDRSRSEGICEIGPGTTVLLYTDGLVERRGEPLDDGLKRLRQAVSERESAVTTEGAEAIVRAVADSGPRDDICVLMARPLQS